MLRELEIKTEDAIAKNRIRRLECALSLKENQGRWEYSKGDGVCVWGGGVFKS